MRTRRRGPAAFWAALFVAAAAPAQAQRVELEKVDRDLSLERAAAERLTRQGASVLEELEAWEQALAPLEADARAAQKAADDAARKVADAEAREIEAKRALDASIDALGPRLAARYRLDRSGAARFLATSASAAQFVRRKRMLDRLVAQDLGALREANGRAAVLAALRAERDRDRALAADRATVALQKTAEARGRRRALSRLHRRILDEQALHARSVAELERAHARLTALIDKARQGAFQGRSVIAAMRGRLPWPASGAVEVGFGKVVNPKFQTVTFHKGLDLRAPEGAAVVAVAPGKVVHAGWFRGYGNLVILDHGDGYHSLAAHLSRIARATGDEVAALDLIGEVGETGSLKGPHLYFEIRHRGKPVDPSDWLGRPR